MIIASRITVIVTMLLVAAVGFMPPRQALDYDNTYLRADGTLAPRTIPVSRVGILNTDIYRYNYHQGGGAYTDIAASIDIGRLIAELALVIALGGIVFTIACRPWRISH